MVFWDELELVWQHQKYGVKDHTFGELAAFEINYHGCQRAFKIKVQFLPQSHLFNQQP